MAIITPVSDAAFSLSTLLEGERLARQDPSKLTDHHLGHVVLYDPKGAAEMLHMREKALADVSVKALARPKAPAAAAVVADALSANLIDELTTGIVAAMKELITPRDARLSALEMENITHRHTIKMLELKVSELEAGRAPHVRPNTSEEDLSTMLASPELQ